VVLTFDDNCRSHLEFVAPLLREHGLSATFFVTAYRMEDRENYFDFEGAAELHRLGFEIGNHTFDHTCYSGPEQAQRLPDQLRRHEEALATVGVPRPTTFGWPGNNFGPEARQALRAAGYRLARRGPGPEYPWFGRSTGPVYDPAANDRLLIPSCVVNSDWTVSHFRSVIARAVAGRAVVIQFHGVPDPAAPHLSTDPQTFREFVSVLVEEGCNVIAMRDLLRYGVERVPCRDPMTQIRR
jgi:peptidoglycan/xylan/chitin deacetylase (PgdA/CDA1 family)